MPRVRCLKKWLQVLSNSSACGLPHLRQANSPKRRPCLETKLCHLHHLFLQSLLSALQARQQATTPTRPQRLLQDRPRPHARQRYGVLDHSQLPPQQEDELEGPLRPHAGSGKQGQVLIPAR
jgi:hypothetical protein